MRKIFGVVLAGAAFAGLAAHAQNTTLYKLIHPDGKVEYVEKAPKDFPGKVVPVTVNPEQNKAMLGKGTITPPPSTAARDARVSAARAKLDAARAALKDAQDNPKEEDITYLGNVNGSTRPVPSDVFKEKVAKLEKAVKDAELALAKAEGS
jgi:hypothetical protein